MEAKPKLIRQDQSVSKKKSSHSEMPLIRICIADDHAIMRDGLKRIFHSTGDIEVVAEAADGTALLSLLRTESLDVLLLDMSMPGKNGIDLIKDIRKLSVVLPILVFTMHDEEQYAVRAIRAGASGYIMKESAGTELLAAVRKVASGRPYISSALAEQLAIDVMPATMELPHQRLSKREYEVFSLLVSGKSITEIARLLYLSVKTVSTHKMRIMQKLRLHSFSDMIQYAVAHRLIVPPPAN